MAPERPKSPTVRPKSPIDRAKSPYKSIRKKPSLTNTVVRAAVNGVNGTASVNGTPTANGMSNGSADVSAAPKSSIVAYNVTCALEEGRFPPRYRYAAWELLLRDITFLFRNLSRLTTAVCPLPPLGVDITATGLVGQVGMVVASVLLTIGLLVCVVVGTPIVAIVSTVLFVQVANHLQGEPIRESDAGVTIPPAAGTEAWFFVNGIGTNGVGAQLAANRLEQLFNRRITTIVNRSLGVWFDILECILQRDLDLNTPDIRAGYKLIRSAVRNPKKKRVVIIGHSQGGIAVSAWVDQLLNDFPEEILSKVEVYTFGSVANHFSRPTSKNLDFPFLRTTNTSPFGCVEHFANADDVLAQFGVLSHAPQCPPADKVVPGTLPTVYGDFGGRIFVRTNRGGHLFLSHYLNPDDSILDAPDVRRNSNLITYFNGRNIARA